MWVANAATVSPSADTADARVQLHAGQSLRISIARWRRRRPPAILRAIFPDTGRFVVHDALPGVAADGRRGRRQSPRLARDPRLPRSSSSSFGRRAYGGGPVPAPFPARQTFEASAAVARRHGLVPARVGFAQQNPDAIDAGVFHNDVIAVGHRDVLFCHERAFVDVEGVMRSESERLRHIAFVGFRTRGYS
jgi:succinylarginine dihydrolase